MTKKTLLQFLKVCNHFLENNENFEKRLNFQKICIKIYSNSTLKTLLRRFIVHFYLNILIKVYRVMWHVSTIIKCLREFALILTIKKRLILRKSIKNE